MVTCKSITKSIEAMAMAVFIPWLKIVYSYGFVLTAKWGVAWVYKVVKYIDNLTFNAYKCELFVVVIICADMDMDMLWPLP